LLVSLVVTFIRSWRWYAEDMHSYKQTAGVCCSLLIDASAMS